MESDGLVQGNCGVDEKRRCLLARRGLAGIALMLIMAWPGLKQSGAQSTAAWQPDLTQKQDYTLHSATSKDQTGANSDARTVTPGQTLTVMEADGPGMISHMWFTINDSEPYHLKRIVLRIYWDNEATPSVETPIGDFFGLGTGDYVMYQSEMLSVGGLKALNCFFPMPYAKHAKVTVTNEGKFAVQSLYYNIDYRENRKPLPPHTMYFHAQYRQATPNHGWTGEFFGNGDPLVVYKRNETGADNYVWFEAQGGDSMLV